MEVCFLGVGAAVPAPGQANCAYLVRLPGATLLFDCGPAILQQLAAVNRTPGDFTHLFVSHRHGDHVLGYPMLVLWHALESGSPGKVPPVITSAATAATLKLLWEQVYPDGPPPEVDFVILPQAPASHELVPGVTLRTWPMVHSEQAPVLGLRIEAEGKVVAFTADASADQAVVDLARGADLLVADARYAATVHPARTQPSRFHCTALEVGELARQAGARRLALVHIGPEYAGREDALVAEAKTVFPGQVIAPAAGDVITL